MLPLHTQAEVVGFDQTAIAKVLTLDEAEKGQYPRSNVLIWSDTALPNVIEQGYLGIVSPNKLDLAAFTGPSVHNMRTHKVIEPGNVIRVRHDSARISVLYRRGSRSNTLMATERCNSFCIMCSQPPREVSDQWYVDEILKTIPLIDKDSREIGLSGGEPTLLENELMVILHQMKNYLPNTGLHILSNGRKFSDPTFASAVGAVNHPKTTWGIPLYSDSFDTHDYVVQSVGAWDETIEGLYNLAAINASIELRVVVQKSTLPRLSALSHFIARNLSFVDHVAFMGLEPMGFARANYAEIWVDPADCMASLEDAVFHLSNRGISTSLFNFPLCTITPDLRSFSRNSISDWKNKFLPECCDCHATQHCCGFFGTINDAWVSRAVRPFSELEAQVVNNMRGSDG
ncbi:His-Xaa-Ser system radical SAM maturase HxsC [Nitrincola sp.]|uniref:His-Xaa-Ser system radical SAM maturase HxsC n=1 Tax=Nitrincola sp. TaxID=1926584 RepID=UPI003A9024F6